MHRILSLLPIALCAHAGETGNIAPTSRQDGWTWTSAAGTCTLLHPRVSLQEKTGVVILDLKASSAAAGTNTWTIHGPDRPIGNLVQRIETQLIEGRAVARRTVQFTPATGIGLDLRFELPVSAAGRKDLLLPCRNGVMRPAGKDGHFILGLGVADVLGPELAMPMVGWAPAAAGPALTMTSDPFGGAGFAADGGTLTMSWWWRGSREPLAEERQQALTWTPASPPGVLSGWASAVPDITAAPTWVHGMALGYYDFLGDKGQAWDKDIDALAARVPADLRKRVTVTLHGWYDQLGSWSYDHASGTLRKEWISRPADSKVPMSLAEVHRRIAHAKSKGFRVIMYAATCLVCDDQAPWFKPAYALRDQGGKPKVTYWKGPDSLGRNTVLDPSHPEVIAYYRGYQKALLAEFGAKIDGINYDETFFIPQNCLAWRDGKSVAADRAFLRLIAQLTRDLQTSRAGNPDLVLLSSDCVDFANHVAGGRIAPAALVSHGTWQDSHMNPAAWPSALLPNARNALWSCNWNPVKNRDFNRAAHEQWRLPQCLSNGWGDNLGPASMPKDILDEVIARFLARCADPSDRVRWLDPPR